MHMAHQLRDARMGLDQSRREFLRVRRRVANAFNARDFGDIFQQQRKIGAIGFAVDRRAPGVDVLAEQRHFFDALGSQFCNFRQHIVERSRDFFAAGVGHDAERTVFAAALHDRYEGGDAVDAGGRQMIEFFDFGK